MPISSFTENLASWGATFMQPPFPQQQEEKKGFVCPGQCWNYVRKSAFTQDDWVRMSLSTKVAWLRGRGGSQVRSKIMADSCEWGYEAGRWETEGLLRRAGRMLMWERCLFPHHEWKTVLLLHRVIRLQPETKVLLKGRWVLIRKCFHCATRIQKSWDVCM